MLNLTLGGLILGQKSCRRTTRGFDPALTPAADAKFVEGFCCMGCMGASSGIFLQRSDSCTGFGHRVLQQAQTLAFVRVLSGSEPCCWETCSDR